MKIYFYHNRDSAKRITSTVAIAKVGQVAYRGIAIVSPKDNGSKAQGRRLAEARLRAAFNSGHNILPINCDYCENAPYPIIETYKGIKGATLTPYESKILGVK